MEQKSFIFIKDFHTHEGIIKQNSELRLFRGFVYLNGGMVHPAYQNILLNIVDDSELRKEYLEEVNIINNKI